MPDTGNLLSTEQMAHFVADGYLRFEALVPDAVNSAVLSELPTIEASKFANFGVTMGDTIRPNVPDTLAPLSACYADSDGLGAFLRLPAVKGIITSLVGPEPVFDHDFVHRLRAGHREAQHLHPDAIVDSPTPDFDIQLFYFPHEVLPGGGGTRFVPGSHLHRVVSASTARYQHIVGDQFFAGPAGTVMVFHHTLWHAGQANSSDIDRWMYKIRLGPATPQVRLWDIGDLAGMHNDPTDHIFTNARTDSVAAILRSMPPWLGTDESRYALAERSRLWRYVSGDDEFDTDYYLTRRERRAVATQTHLRGMFDD